MTRSSSKEDLGEPLDYDPDFHGPLKNRSCTDVICLLLFLAFIICWGALGWYAITHGDPQTLLVPKDSYGSRCGMDSHVADRPYLFFFDLTKCLEPTVVFTGCNTPQVCVKSCPNTTYIEGDGSTTDITPYCIYDGSNCPKWYLPSQSVQKRCVPLISTIGNLSDEVIQKISQLTDTNSSSLIDNLKKAVSNIQLLAQAEEVGQNIVKDIIVSRWKILIGVVLALFACIIYILILRWIASFMVWFSILGVVAMLTAGVYFTSVEYVKWKNMSSTYDDVQGIQTKRDLWLAALIILSIALGVILLMLIFLRKRIVLAIALVREGSKAVSSVTSVLFFPIFPWFLEVGVVAYAICVALYLSTTGEPIYRAQRISEECSTLTGIQNGSTCTSQDFMLTINQTSDITTACSNATCKFISMENDRFYPYMQAVNVFGFFWLACFVTAFGQMVLAGVFAQWYWTWFKEDLPFFAVTSAIYRTLRYHIGTIAFGSLIIAICKMIRAVLEYADHKLKKYGDNELVKAIMCCLKCFFWCLEKFLKFINKNAYIMCAIHGKNFCTSAKQAFLLLMRNILRVFVLDKVTDFLFFISKVLVTVGVGAVAYVIFATDLVSFVDNSNLNYGIVPVVIIMVATYLIASLFFSVYSMAVDTLFLCFLEDCERNDGSHGKPYYMSKNLMKIFGKKNKFS